jgi:phenylpropionate dioxygenase-like ring-hydroxylating dioxygenase large terminal subunit
MPPDYLGMTLGDKAFAINRTLLDNPRLLANTLKHELQHLIDRQILGNPGAYGQELEDSATNAEK